MSYNDSQGKSQKQSPGTGPRVMSRGLILENALDMQVPALPRTVRMVHALTAEHSVNARAIADAIMTDCGLTLKFFRVMNSAFFSPYRQDILSIRFMVVLLGFDNTSRIVSSVPLINPAEHAMPLKIMAMSLLASEFIGALSATTLLDRESAVPCAMFASLGHLALATVVPDAYIKVWTEEKFPWSRDSFKKTTGWLPKDLALRIARAWNLPMLIRECIQPPEDLSRVADDKRALMVTVASLEQMLFCAALMKRSDEAQLRLRDRIKKVLKLNNKKFSKAIKDGLLSFEKNNPAFYELLRKEEVLSHILV